MGDAESGPIRLSFNPQLRVEFRGATVTSDAWLLLPRELDERLGPDRATPHLIRAQDRIGNFRCQTSSARRSTAAWRATRIPTTPSDWPRIRRFGCWPRASGGKRGSPSRQRCIVRDGRPRR